MNEVWFSWDGVCAATAGDWLGAAPDGRAAAGVSAVLDDSRRVLLKHPRVRRGTRVAQTLRRLDEVLDDLQRSLAARA